MSHVRWSSSILCSYCQVTFGCHISKMYRMRLLGLTGLLGYPTRHWSFPMELGKTISLWNFWTESTTDVFREAIEKASRVIIAQTLDSSTSWYDAHVLNCLFIAMEATLKIWLMCINKIKVNEIKKILLYILLFFVFYLGNNNNICHGPEIKIEIMAIKYFPWCSKNLDQRKVTYEKIFPMDHFCRIPYCLLLILLWSIVFVNFHNSL